MDWNYKISQAVWIAHALFERGKTSGTTANISFLDNEVVWISCSGSCFGLLEKSDFVPVHLDGTCINSAGKKPSKELPLHLELYNSSNDVQAVIHVHSPYGVLWSCVPHTESRDIIPEFTPYLKLKLGNVVLVPYAKPGSNELFELMHAYVGKERGYLLANHGPIVAGKTLMNAFESVEELEQSSMLAWNSHVFDVQLNNIQQEETL